MKKRSYEIVIIGGGILGLSLSIALAKKNIKVLLVEKSKFEIISNNQIPDLRISSINMFSVKFFKDIGIWKYINNKFCVPFNTIKVWEYSSLFLEFKAKDFNLKNLGFLIENKRLIRALLKKANALNHLRILHSTTPRKIEYNGKFWIVSFNKCIVDCKMIVGSDGSKSWVRKKVGIAYKFLDYYQSCLLAIIKIKNIKKTIWQEFNIYGPISLLPLYDNWSLLIWYDSSSKIRNLMNMTSIEVKNKIFKVFEKNILNNFHLAKYSICPIFGYYTSSYVKPGVVLIGDSAHTIHPLAGQGLNLGLRDVKVLSDLFINFYEENKINKKIQILLNKYQYIRFKDNITMQLGVDFLHFLFKKQNVCSVFLRNLLIFLVNNNQFIKGKIINYASYGKIFF